ncbi:MAG: hypothetical protein GTO12_23590 [Proteobacteria bacterium]|nr:hypothetical protein [Pseudomonadota bacterium]
MKRTVIPLGLSLLVVVTLAVAALAGDSVKDLTIVYSNNINGTVRPCPT